MINNRKKEEKTEITNLSYVKGQAILAKKSIGLGIGIMGGFFSIVGLILALALYENGFFIMLFVGLILFIIGFSFLNSTKEYGFFELSEQMNILRKEQQRQKKILRVNPELATACYKCRHTIIKSANYCPFCGAQVINKQNKQLIYENENKTQDLEYCPNCGTKIEKDFKICPYCGSYIS